MTSRFVKVISLQALKRPRNSITSPDIGVDRFLRNPERWQLLNLLVIVCSVWAASTVIAAVRLRVRFRAFHEGNSATLHIVIAQSVVVAVLMRKLLFTRLPEWLIYPAPVVALVFILPIAIGRRFLIDLQSKGTIRTRPLESLCSSVLWSGIFGIACSLLASLYYHTDQAIHHSPGFDW